MNRETIEKIFNFLNTKEGKEIPKKWLDSIEKLKLIHELENHPDGVQYKHHSNLNLISSNITKLPNDLYVGGDFYLSKCKQLIKLPDDLYVVNNLTLSYTNISEIPNNLYVGTHLFIYDTPLAENYTVDEIRKMITSKGGTIKGIIMR
jgi:Leucine-rich repeat (LRR) protein